MLSLKYDIICIIFLNVASNIYYLATISCG